jgi:hypothetical protein
MVQFLTQNIDRFHPSLRSKQYVKRNHFRSYENPDFPDSLIDDEGNVFLDFDTKGGGEKNYKSFGRRSNGDREGLADIDACRRDTKYSNIFSKWGVRTHKTLAIARIHTLTEDPAASRALFKSFEREVEPAMQFRAFRNNIRLADCVGYGVSEEDVEDMLEHSRKTLNVHENLNLQNHKEYLLWLAETLGKNYGIMHGHGFVHQYATTHNMTLAGETVDLDTVMSVEIPDDTYYSSKNLGSWRKGYPGWHLKKGMFGEVTLKNRREPIDNQTAIYRHNIIQDFHGRAVSSVCYFASSVSAKLGIGIDVNDVKEAFFRGYEAGQMQARATISNKKRLKA